MTPIIKLQSNKLKWIFKPSLHRIEQNDNKLIKKWMDCKIIKRRDRHVQANIVLNNYYL